jgi:adenylate cyclase
MKKIIWGTVILFSGFYLFSVFNLLDLDYFDWQMRSRFQTPPVSEDIVIVAVDDESLGWLGGWPWPRSFHAQMIENLKKHGAKLIALDIIFDSPQTLSLKGKNQDQILRAAIKKNNPVVLASLFTQRQAVKYGLIQTHNEPIAALSEVSAGFGFANPVFDNDGVVRRSQLQVIQTVNQNSKNYQSFSATVAELLMQKKITSVPLDRDGFFIINYHGAAGRYRTVPFNQVLDGSIFKAQPDLFKNKTVLVGSTAVILQDFFSTPFNAQKLMSGVEVRANEIDTLLNRQFIYCSPKIFNLLFLILSLTAMGWGINFFKGLKGLAFMLAVLAIIHVFNYLIFNFYNNIE